MGAEMDEAAARAAVAALIRDRGADCASLSRLIGRNAAYLQQYLQRGTPRRLAEHDIANLAQFFGVPARSLGSRADDPAATYRSIPRYALAASAGPGALVGDVAAGAGIGFTDAWLRRLAPRGGATRLSVIEVAGTSMQPTLEPGDEILVDTGDTRADAGIFVLRIGDALLVKRLVRGAAGFAIASDNPDAPPVAATLAEAVIVGRVRWTGRRLA